MQYMYHLQMQFVLAATVLLSWPSLLAVHGGPGIAKGPGPGPGRNRTSHGFVENNRALRGSIGVYILGSTSSPSVSKKLNIDSSEEDKGDCPSCPKAHILNDKQKSDTARLESIKIQILSKLGLHSKPNVTSTKWREMALETIRRTEEEGEEEDPEEQKDGTRPFLSEEEDDFYGKTSEIISFSEPGAEYGGQTLLEFSQSQQADSSLRVKSAVLWVDLRLSPKGQKVVAEHHQKMSLYVFRVLNPKEFNRTAPSREWNNVLLASQKVLSSDLGWKRFDISNGVQKWFAEGGDEKLRLLIDCSGCGSLVKPVVTQSDPEKKKKKKHKQKNSRLRDLRRTSQRPFLVIHTETTPNRRLRRRALVCSATTKSCCKERFFVSFKDLGWDDWIIAPSGYYANYCRGECSGARNPDTFLNYHSHILGEYRKLERFPELQPCCSPTKFSPMSLIYLGPDRSIIKRDLPKMVIQECGCP